MRESLHQLCPACAQPNECAIAAGKSASACWCMGEPAQLPVPADDSSCYCQRCLTRIRTAAHDGQGDLP